ncbi:MAG: hydrogenase expression/formation protein HypE [Bacteroidales bacterium]|nr:hydrogenase expression/formation protein HypE [Bacteroidales bacterium]MDZ4203800.1 hydrogenase expression/formation protein HypE [Bacteroidales bacterium]
MQTTNKILLGHGSGGRMMHNLITELFARHFNDPVLDQQTDAALLSFPFGNLAFTTDAFVVQPLFFTGGDIGKLSVCGTVNDLVASGATPLWISAAFIIEEGLEVSVLEDIVKSMASSARQAGVRIVCGDTKVVGKGQCDRLFITTSGIGQVQSQHLRIATGELITAGDHIIISGTLGDHGMAVLAARNELGFASKLLTDCAPLNLMVQPLLDENLDIRFMRDPTRGGLATVLCEIAENKDFGIIINEEQLPVSEAVRGMCELYGFDPLYIANEGKMLIISSPKDSSRIIEILKKSPEGRQATLIGEVSNDHTAKVLLKTQIGGTRMITMLAGEQLPRIC